MKVSNSWKMLAGVVIAVLCLYIFLKDVDTKSLFSELKSTNIFSLIVTCLLIILTIYLRSLRWKFMLPEIPGSSKKYLFSNVMIGFMINNIMPARIGEFARSFILWKKNRFPLVVSFGTLIIERIVDLLMFFLFFIIPVFILPQCSSLIPYAFLFTGIIIFSVVCIVLYFHFQNTSITIALWAISKLPEKFRDRSLKICKELATTLTWLKSPGCACITMCLSFLTVLCYPMMIIILAGNSGISFGLLEGMFAQAFAAFGAAIPLAPGYVGTLHAVMLQGLEILGMNADKARALIIKYHALNYILITVLGLYFFFRMKLSIKEISIAKEEMT